MIAGRVRETLILTRGPYHICSALFDSNQSCLLPALQGCVRTIACCQFARRDGHLWTGEDPNCTVASATWSLE